MERIFNSQIFDEAMQHATTEALRLRVMIATQLDIYITRLREEGRNFEECSLLAEAYCRSLIGGIVAFYLDNIVPEEDRDKFGERLLRAADQIGAILNAKLKGEHLDDEEDEEDGERESNEDEAKATVQ